MKEVVTGFIGCVAIGSRFFATVCATTFCVEIQKDKSCNFNVTECLYLLCSSRFSSEPSRVILALQGELLEVDGSNMPAKHALTATSFERKNKSCFSYKLNNNRRMTHRVSQNLPSKQANGQGAPKQQTWAPSFGAVTSCDFDNRSMKESRPMCSAKQTSRLLQFEANSISKHSKARRAD